MVSTAKRIRNAYRKSRRSLEGGPVSLKRFAWEDCRGMVSDNDIRAWRLGKRLARGRPLDR